LALNEFVLIDRTLHDRKQFSCGKQGLDDFLKTKAVKHMEIGLSRTWVLTDPEESTLIAAFYTLANYTVKREQIPKIKQLPKSLIPVVLLAQMAVDTNYQGHHLGEKTLITPLRQAVILADSGLPVIGLVLDAYDEEALAFYQRYESFSPCPDNHMRLFASIHELRLL